MGKIFSQTFLKDFVMKLKTYWQYSGNVIVLSEAGTGLTNFMGTKELSNSTLTMLGSNHHPQYLGVRFIL